MQWILVNIPFLIAVVLMIVLMGIAFKNGAIKTIGGIVSAIVSSILVILISFLVREYFYNEKLVMVLTIVLCADMPIGSPLSDVCDGLIINC